MAKSLLLRKKLNILRLDYFAKRTFDESGDYTVNKFLVNVTECLNDRQGNNGEYYSDQITFDGNEPSEDLAC